MSFERKVLKRYPMALFIFLIVNLYITPTAAEVPAQQQDCEQIAGPWGGTGDFRTVCEGIVGVTIDPPSQPIGITIEQNGCQISLEGSPFAAGPITGTIHGNSIQASGLLFHPTAFGNLPVVVDPNVVTAHGELRGNTLCLRGSGRAESGALHQAKW